MVIDTARTYTATIVTTQGELVVKLFDDEAPIAVNNFIVLANLGFYDRTPIPFVQPEDSLVMGAPDNNPLNDAGYRFPAEVGALESIGVGGIAFIPMEQLPDGSLLSSSSQVLVALIEVPDEAVAAFPFFAQVVGGTDVLTKLTTSDLVESVTITSDGE
jgi:cyclophilin family peptidyl-prolyl cis-trans isomerase